VQIVRGVGAPAPRWVAGLGPRGRRSEWRQAERSEAVHPRPRSVPLGFGRVPRRAAPMSGPVSTTAALGSGWRRGVCRYELLEPGPLGRRAVSGCVGCVRSGRRRRSGLLGAGSGWSKPSGLGRLDHEPGVLFGPARASDQPADAAPASRSRGTALRANAPVVRGPDVEAASSRVAIDTGFLRLGGSGVAATSKRARTARRAGRPAVREVGRVGVVGRRNRNVGGLGQCDRDSLAFRPAFDLSWTERAELGR
jgi:hypothetical protein